MPQDEAHVGESDLLGPGERAELRWLRSENALLRTERDMLVRIAAGFAEDLDAALSTVPRVSERASGA